MGSKSFHNFHKLKGKDLRRKSSKNYYKNKNNDNDKGNSKEVPGIIGGLVPELDNNILSNPSICGNKESIDNTRIELDDGAGIEEEEDDEEEEEEDATDSEPGNDDDDDDFLESLRSGNSDVIANAQTSVSSVTEGNPEYSVQKKVFRIYEEWKGLPREISIKTKGNMFCIEAKLVQVPATTTTATAGVEGSNEEVKYLPMVSIKVLGQAFLLNQIRLMVGAAVMIVRGVLPPWTIQTALLVPLQVPLPLAPAEGLVLLDAGFGRNVNRQTVYLCPPPVTSADSSVSSMRASEHQLLAASLLAPPSPPPLTLLPPAAYQDSNTFLNNRIRTRILADWTQPLPKYTPTPAPPSQSQTQTDQTNPNIHNPSDPPEDTDMPAMTLVDEWLLFCERYRVPEPIGRELRETCQTYLELEKRADAEKNEKDIRRILKEVTYVRELAQELKADLVAARDSPRAKKKLLNISKLRVVHKRLLPNSFATALSREFRLPPGDVLSEALRAVASALVSGEIPHDTSTEDILAIMKSSGGVTGWASRTDMHPLVD